MGNVDPSGEILVPPIAGAWLGFLTTIGKDGANFGDFLAGTLLGAASAVVGAGVGKLAAGGSFFGNGVASVSGFWNRAAGGFTGGLVDTGSFSQALDIAGNSVLTGARIRAGTSMVTGFAAAKKSGKNIWTGNETKLVSNKNH